MDVLNSIWEFLEPVLYTIFDFLCSVISGLFFWLPPDPFGEGLETIQFFIQSNVTAIKWLNWFVPVQLFSAVFGLVLSAFLVWIGYMLACKVFDWIKIIKQTINPGG